MKDGHYSDIAYWGPVGTRPQGVGDKRMAEIINVTDSNFEEAVLKNSKPVLLDFWAEWCGPCKQMAPALEAIAAEHDQIVVAKLNIDQNGATPSKYGVRGIPTLMLFSQGCVEETLVGAVPKDVLRKKLSPWLS